MSEWKEYRIKDIASMIGSGTTPSSKVERYYDPDKTGHVKDRFKETGFIS